VRFVPGELAICTCDDWVAGEYCDVAALGRSICAGLRAGGAGCRRTPPLDCGVAAERWPAWMPAVAAGRRGPAENTSPQPLRAAERLATRRLAEAGSTFWSTTMAASGLLGCDVLATTVSEPSALAWTEAPAGDPSASSSTTSTSSLSPTAGGWRNVTSSSLAVTTTIDDGSLCSSRASLAATPQASASESIVPASPSDGRAWKTSMFGESAWSFDKSMSQ
jgi:hypothetical protein